jgi:muconolactone delta-isomerase
MDARTMQYMVDFTLPKDLTEEFVSKIQQQRNQVNKLMSEGKLLSYALALEVGKLWAVFAVASETELMELLSELPLTSMMKMRVSELTFYNASQPFIPAFSVN